MLWAIAVVLVTLWLLGLGAGFTMGSFIHVLYVAAVALLVVGVSREAVINRRLRHASYGHVPKRDRKRRRERLADLPIPLRSIP